jgi:hypothetical protein
MLSEEEDLKTFSAGEELEVDFKAFNAGELLLSMSKH